MEKLPQGSNWHISDEIQITEFRDKWRDKFIDCHKQWSEISSQKPVESELESDPGNQNENAINQPRDLNGQSSIHLSAECLLRIIPSLIIKELEEKCSLESLACTGETSEYVFADSRLKKPDHILPHIPKDHGLVTLTLQENELKKRWSDVKYKKDVIRNMKYLNAEKLLQTKSRICENEDVTELQVDPNDVILSVIVCRPSRFYARYNLRRGGAKYLVLGSQKLTELRNVIVCATDYQRLGDFSINPKTSNTTIAKDVYKSGFFFINGVFYNDMRNPTCHDYSKVIRDWIGDNPETQAKYGCCSAKAMEHSSFNDLKIKQGHFYLYIHQGDCEHLIMFNDIRLVNAADSKDRSHYPFCYSAKKNKGFQCMICFALPVKWVTKNNERVHADPFLFCDGCFYSFNYDSEGRKIGEFLAQHYVDL